ncbi:glycoside hydrolase family 15 protein [Cesiribacter sp. SM1]|uniref:glycoside hydrolase family 15 protein n=1 Tax=Cesiribacter sp. SM1 TaxID=2861196 RepID=UPI001CD458F3|nr:glycoside hydrolase family 15 protein [Cesiribacter sp. SM1]
MKSAPRSAAFVSLPDLALIGDRRSCALLDKQGNVVWYCPERFDKPAMLAYLLDPEKGGSWQLLSNGLSFKEREYIAESAILRTRLSCPAGELVLEDWMPLNGRFYGICRRLSAAPLPVTLRLTPRPNYARSRAVLELREEKHACIDFNLHLYASHPLEIQEDAVCCNIPEGEKAWFALAEKTFECHEILIEESYRQTLENWAKVASHISYKGPYEKEVHNSLRLLRMLTFHLNGGVIAAATTSLPEVLEGDRNYDYRYVWLRDAAMIVSALTRAGSDGVEERQFLSFICSAMHRLKEPVVPFFTLDEQPAPHEQEIPLQGYRNSRPVRIGNNANNQLQLDASSNVLIAAKVIYNAFNTREHWETIRMLANYVCEHWQEPDHGMWEEKTKKHFTSSKVIASCSLEYIAKHSQDEQEKKRWLQAAGQIRLFIEENCLTPEGAYAAYAGAQTVDVSAVLFPIWGFVDAETAEIIKTVEVLERDYCYNHLYRRQLINFDAKKEGVFLAGSLWVAQYWVMRKNWQKVEASLDAILPYMNDIGIMPEEADPDTGEWLGNLPQTFVHASLIGTLIDYKRARYDKDKTED